jgi:hypothetical protein
MRRLTEPFGKAGLTVAILALVLALVGGAYAAGGLNPVQKKQVIKIAKKYAGKPGAPGATGPAGVAGTNGTNGKNGTAGKNGESVAISSASAGECPEGGSKFTVGAEAGKACNGSPWVAGGTLPSGKTESGWWSLSVPVHDPTTGTSLSFAPISFVIPLESAPTAIFLKAGETEPINCPGTAGEPKAKLGFLCVYTFQELEAPSLGVSVLTEVGAVVGANHGGEPGGAAFGTWAVTAG